MNPQLIARSKVSGRRPDVLGVGFVILALAAGASGARAETYPLASGADLVGAINGVRTKYEDTFSDIARRAGLGYDDMLRANPGIDPWLPGEDTDIVLPTQFVLPAGNRQGLVINIAEFRLYYFTRVDGREVVATFPISIGRMDWATPLGKHRILSKQKRPTWYPPESIRAEHAAEGDILPKAIPPGPDNPLGDFAMRLSQSGYLIHGTNKPVGIGMQVTHGCIRMYPEDIEWLFPQIPVGAAVQIVNQPYKLGWEGDALYLEVHPALDGDSAAAEQGMTQLTEAYVQATQGRAAQVDWPLVEEVYRAKLGIPVRIASAVPAVAAAVSKNSDVLTAGEPPGSIEKYPAR
jgi:L,D-transpeptidase ErfK/SrfK